MRAIGGGMGKAEGTIHAPCRLILGLQEPICKHEVELARVAQLRPPDNPSTGKDRPQTTFSTWKPLRRRPLPMPPSSDSAPSLGCTRRRVMTSIALEVPPVPSYTDNLFENPPDARMRPRMPAWKSVT